ncbi:ABC transporter permease [Rubeoparvulum massiliense]|uniref:ABC transporter permease n=1 Tax=Rubeoparvulum massiliense TaxID=1631346 RepID=UPI00065E3983|nr:ABC transporter permease [Rubeoparvulum massiliense]
MKKQSKLIALNFKMILRNRQFTIMSFLFPVVMMVLMGIAGDGQSRDEMSYMSYITPGILGMCIAATGLIGLPIMMVSFREQEILKRIFATPFSVQSYLGSVLVAKLFIIMIQLSFVLLIGIFIFDVHFYWSWQAGLICGALLLFGSLAVLATGLLVSNFLPNSQAASAVGNMMNLLFVFLSGGFFPTETWPSFLQPVITVIPLTPIINGVRELLVFNQGISDVFIQYAIVLGVEIFLFLFIASKTFNWDRPSLLKKGLAKN